MSDERAHALWATGSEPNWSDPSEVPKLIQWDQRGHAIVNGVVFGQIKWDKPPSCYDQSYVWLCWLNAIDNISKRERTAEAAKAWGTKQIRRWLAAVRKLEEAEPEGPAP